MRRAISGLGTMTRENGQMAPLRKELVRTSTERDILK
jgi:hypothetical protein